MLLCVRSTCMSSPRLIVALDHSPTVSHFIYYLHHIGLLPYLSLHLTFCTCHTWVRPFSSTPINLNSCPDICCYHINFFFFFPKRKKQTTCLKLLLISTMLSILLTIFWMVLLIICRLKIWKFLWEGKKFGVMSLEKFLHLSRKKVRPKFFGNSALNYNIFVRHYSL